MSDDRTITISRSVLHHLLDVSDDCNLAHADFVRTQDAFYKAKHKLEAVSTKKMQLISDIESGVVKTISDIEVSKK